jgi:hypothetical protein
MVNVNPFGYPLFDCPNRYPASVHRPSIFRPVLCLLQALYQVGTILRCRFPPSALHVLSTLHVPSSVRTVLLLPALTFVEDVCLCGRDVKCSFHLRRASRLLPTQWVALRSISTAFLVKTRYSYGRSLSWFVGVLGAVATVKRDLFRGSLSSQHLSLLLP